MVIIIQYFVLFNKKKGRNQYHLRHRKRYRIWSQNPTSFTILLTTTFTISLTITFPMLPTSEFSIGDRLDAIFGLTNPQVDKAKEFLNYMIMFIEALHKL